MGKKNFLFLAFILALPLCLLAQRSKVQNLPNYDKKKLHFGFTLGTNVMYFAPQFSNEFLHMDTIYSVEAKSGAGFHLGGIANFRLNEYFDARALFVLAFSQRDLHYTTRIPRKDDTVDWEEEVIKVESIFTKFPLLIKLKAERKNNYRPYLFAGVTPYLDLAAGGEEQEPYVHLNKFDVFYDVGMGSDFYLYYFKFALEFKYSFGVMNVLQADHQQYSRALNGMYSHMFSLSLNFE